MTNMFKKTLLAASVAALSSSAIAADFVTDDVSGTAYVKLGSTNFEERLYSNEYLAEQAAAEADVTLGDVQVVVGADYNESDLIRITLTGADLVDANPTFVGNDDSAGTITGGVDASGEQANFISRDGNTLIFRVDTGGLSEGGRFTLSGVEIDPSSVTGDIDFEYNAQVSGTDLPLDNQGADEGTIFSTADQFEYEVTKAFNAQIDVSNSREVFTETDGAPATNVKDQATITVTDNAGDFVTGGTVTLTDIRHTITGDFTKFVDADGEQLAVGDVFSLTTGSAETNGEPSINEAGDELTFVTQDSVVTFELTNENIDGAIQVQDFSITSSLVADFEASSVYEYASFSDDAGSWTLNGSQVNVSYMPYRSDISQVINVTNTSGQEGDISVVATAEDGEEYDLGVVATAEPGSLTRIAGAIIDGLNEATGVDHQTVASTTRYSFEIITNAPEANVEVYSAYNVQGTGARLVVNDSNGGGLSKQ